MTGSGAVKLGTRSRSPYSGMASISSSAICAIRGSMAANRRREKTPDTKRRSRVCSGGSA